MTNLIERYKAREINGVISNSQVLEIWNDIKSDVPELMSLINKIDQRQFITHQEYLQLLDRIKVYSTLTNSVCKARVRQELPPFGKSIEKFCTSIQNQIDFNKVSFVITSPLKRYGLVQNAQLFFEIEPFSLFYIMCRILQRSTTDKDVFLYCLCIKGQEGSKDQIKASWTALQYLLEKDYRNKT